MDIEILRFHSLKNQSRDSKSKRKKMIRATSAPSYSSAHKQDDMNVNCVCSATDKSHHHWNTNTQCLPYFFLVLLPVSLLSLLAPSPSPSPPSKSNNEKNSAHTSADIIIAEAKHNKRRTRRGIEWPHLFASSTATYCGIKCYTQTACRCSFLLFVFVACRTTIKRLNRKSIS